jgi:hypothetical protein
MRLQNRILGTGLALALSLGMMAVPVAAQAQSRSRSQKNETQHRNNAYILGAAGLILNNSHQSTLGTIALAGAAYEAYRLQTDVEKRHDRERYGYNYYNNRSTRDGYYDSLGRWHPNSTGSRYTGSSQNGYYDSQGRWHSTNSTSRTNGYYDRNGVWHSYSSSSNRYDRDNDRYDRDRRDSNCDNRGNNQQRGRDWAATRGKKKGWEKNGKR